MNPVPYDRLNARQRENYNFAKLAAALADYGYALLRLSDDWNGADAIAHHVDGSSVLVQLKSRLAFAKKYRGKRIWVAFPHKGSWYLFPHEKVLDRVLEATGIGRTVSFRKRGGYAFSGVPKTVAPILAKYGL